MTYIREIHGNNFWWQHVRSVPAHEVAQMVYRFRCGLSAQMPHIRRQIQYAVGLR